MLPYHAAAAESLLRSRGCLAVLGRGLGAQAVLLDLALRALRGGGSDGRHAARLVLVLNTPQDEAEVMLQHASGDPGWAESLPRLVAVGADMGVEERAAALARGGVFLAGARVLVPDLLAGRLVPEAIDGILINHAHSVAELSAEAFLLRIYRRANSRGYVRAVSDRPDLFAREPVEQVMKRCFTDQLEVWPRIRREVQNCLQGASQPEVVQRTPELPPCVLDIQRHLLNIVEGTLEELRKDPNLSLGHLAVRDAVFPSFEAEVRRALGPSWQSLGPRTRRVVHDLGGIRRLLAAALRSDAAAFHALLESTFAAEGERDAPAWIFSPDARALHALSKARVYEVAGEGPRSMQLRRTLEPHAKWQVLLDIVDEVVEEASGVMPGATPLDSQRAPESIAFPPPSPLARRAETDNDVVDDSDSDIEVVSVLPAKRPRTAPQAPRPPASPATAAAAPPPRPDLLEPRIVVVVPDETTKRQITSVVSHGPGATLLAALAGYLRGRCSGPSPSQAAGEAGLGAPRAGEAALLAREAAAAEAELAALGEGAAPPEPRRLADGRACLPRVDVVAADGPSGALELSLRGTRPRAVVVCEPSLQVIRALEACCASATLSGGPPPAAAGARVKREPASGARAEAEEDAAAGPQGAPPAPPAETPPPPRVHLLVFKESVEMYRFQQELVQESAAVDALIRARRHLTVRLDDGLAAAAGAEGAELQGLATRRSGRSRVAVQNRVVVDQREFRSSLPFMLYMRDLTIEPVTIPVGDYVLSRDICVERKAIPDLVQSLSSGRLYQQAQSMCQHYARPSLLIEFDPGKSFALMNTYTIARREVDVGARDILGKLSLLVLHFPKLRTIWSPSPRFTADVFLKLKEGRYQPDARAAAEVDADAYAPEPGAAAAPQGRRSNVQALDMLRKLPGVAPGSVHALARRAGSLAGLVEMSEADMALAVGAAGARQLRAFLDREEQQAAEAPAAAGAGSSRG